MKKILLASTALVLSAGLAHAQAVTITGEGRMGIQYLNGAGFVGGSNYRQESRLQLNFNVSVEADHGLSFGAFTRARIQMSGGADSITGPNQTMYDPGVFSAARVWVQYSGFRLTFGNQDGAFRSALTGPGLGYSGGARVGYEGGILAGDTAGTLGISQAFRSTIHPATIASEPRVQASYTFGSTFVSVSYDRGQETEIGVRSTFGAFTVAAAYTNGGAAASSYALVGNYNGGSWGAGAMVARIGGAVTNWNVRGSVQLGGGTLYGYAGRVGGANAYGLNYGYGLGGGATLTVGAERVGAVTGASVGVAFTF